MILQHFEVVWSPKFWGIPRILGVSQNSLCNTIEYACAKHLALLQKINSRWIGGRFLSHSAEWATEKSSPGFSRKHVMTHCVSGSKSSRIHGWHHSQHLLQGHLLNHYPRRDSFCLTYNQFWQGLTESVRRRAKILVDSHLHCMVVITTSHCFF